MLGWDLEGSHDGCGAELMRVLRTAPLRENRMLDAGMPLCCSSWGAGGISDSRMQYRLVCLSSALQRWLMR